MPETAGFPLSIGAALADGARARRSARRSARPRQRPRVAGKVLVAISALGMCCVLAALVRGAWLPAGLMFLVTLFSLELMLQRAMAAFQAADRLPADHALPTARERHAYATATD